jgi:hypothetical protein
MNTTPIRFSIILVIFDFGMHSGLSQSFVNLNFESANVPNVPTNQLGGLVSITLGMPGWTANPYVVEPDMIGHNNMSTGGAFVSIDGPSWPSSQILQGNYSDYIVGSRFGTPASAYIAQTGTIPMFSESIVFDTSLGADFQVTFGGQAIPTEQLGTGANYVIMGGDVSAFAGQSEELRFTALPNVGGGFLDNIQFLTSPVPEPGTLALLAAGAAFLGLRRSRKTLP